MTEERPNLGDEPVVHHRAEPTPDELHEGVRRLASEVDGAFANPHWAILDTATERAKWRLYVGAALRHCTLLLVELDHAAREGLSLTVRILTRAHLEAWLYALYLHFGEYAAIERLAQDELSGAIQLDNAFTTWDTWLVNEKKRRRRQLRKVRRTNEGIEQWNSTHSDLSPKPFLEEPHVPQLARTGIDLSKRIADFGGLTPRELSVAEVVQALTHLAKRRGFARESFEPMYLIYRLISAAGIHPTLSLYDWYLVEGTPGGFVTVGTESTGPALIFENLVTALYATAFLAGWVIPDAGLATPVATELRERLEPDPSGGRGWAPGV